MQQGELTDEQKVKMVHRMAQQSFTQILQQRLQHVTDECFDLCVTNPTYSSRAKERECVLRCSDRSWESLKIISTVVDKMQTPKNETFD